MSKSFDISSTFYFEGFFQTIFSCDDFHQRRCSKERQRVNGYVGIQIEKSKQTNEEEL